MAFKTAEQAFRVAHSRRAEEDVVVDEISFEPVSSFLPVKIDSVLSAISTQFLEESRRDLLAQDNRSMWNAMGVPEAPPVHPRCRSDMAGSYSLGVELTDMLAESALKLAEDLKERIRFSEWNMPKPMIQEERKEQVLMMLIREGAEIQDIEWDHQRQHVRTWSGGSSGFSDAGTEVTVKFHLPPGTKIDLERRD